MGIILMLVVSAFAATQRYLFHTSGAWIEELEQYLLLMTVFVVSGSAYTEGEHVSASMVFRLLPLWCQRPIGAAIDVLGIAFSGFMLREGLLKSYQLYTAHIRSGTSLQTPLYLIALMLPLSMLLLGISFLNHLIFQVKRAKAQAGSTSGGGRASS
ncbi:MAG TPA: TRAP transporter small permease [Candidatus Dormibacteraeota bacterium]|nr:TRAP transporter small permease [Candidatus Dormibacteraeota bacterium]